MVRYGEGGSCTPPFDTPRLQFSGPLIRFQYFLIQIHSFLTDCFQTFGIYKSLFVRGLSYITFSLFDTFTE